ncbi:MAG: shikimate dehydrogenase [Clostridia bacterium]|nr:shikimate dehydrogenase [Clostridia bacterium]
MKYGLIGEKLGHSFSKPIHESIADYTYEIKEIPRDGLDLFMRERAFSGINVTIPYKQSVMPYLDFIDEAAQKIGAVNTVVNRDGKLYGYNTDFGGMKMLIEKQGFCYEGKKIAVLGSGGTAKTARAVAEALGAAEIVTVSRKGKVNYENLLSIHGDCDYIINTTPCGMYPDTDGSAVDVSLFGALSGVTDVVYNPLRTKLCLDCERQGIRCECGLYMLVAQAVLASQIFSGESFDVKKTADEIYLRILNEKRNIVLIGMPGSGKTTVGKALAERLGKTFTDTDDLITQEYGPISNIFEEKGEAFFRDIESVAVKNVALRNGLVIATGGGAVLRKENVEYLKHNGVLFFLDRPLKDIIPTEDRPLSRDLDALKKRYEERYRIYLSSCDEKTEIDGKIENAVSRITEKLK